MKLSKIDRYIIKDLFKSDEGLFIFTIHSRYKISPKNLFEAIKKLEKENIIKLNEDRFSLSKKGIEFAIKNNISTSRDTTQEVSIDEKSIGPKIELNSFYVPQNYK